MFHRIVTVLALSLSIAASATAGRSTEVDAGGPVAWWRFDTVQSETVEVDDNTGELRSEVEKENQANEDSESDDSEEREWVSRKLYFVTDDVANLKDQLFGYHRLVHGVSGKALRFGGLDTYVVRQASSVPHIRGPFSAEAWIAIGAYPVNTCSILAQATESRGALFGIDAYGHIRFDLNVDGLWQRVLSDERIGLGEWAHIACTFEPGGEMTIYLNGQTVGKQSVLDAVDTAAADLLIGKEPVLRKPVGTIRQFGTKKVYTYFDGLMDELKLYDRALGADEIARSFNQQRPAEAPELPERRLPAGPPGTGRFGAFYTTLHYYDSWDAQWRVGDQADVVVRFNENPCRLVFWRGTSYIPHWVTENGIWYDNEFNETWSKHGCHEPMSDKQCRHSQVRIIESNDARVVVHWRYALVDNWYEFARIDPATGWGDWTDEIYTIYPDGIGVREITLHSTNPRAPHEWHEGIVVMGPGQRPEDVLEPEALTMLNMQGQSHSYSWLNGAPEEPTEPPNANIQTINTKSKYRPFIAVPSSSDPEFDIYRGELRRDVSMFPWWNHWPTAFDPCDGRYAMDADRASHSSLTHCHWGPYKETEHSMTKVMLNGVTDKKPEQVVQIARSWDSPPKLSVAGEGFSADGYDPAQRAYLISRVPSEQPTELKIRLLATMTSPIANMAFKIDGWDSEEVSVEIDGKPAKFRAASLDRLVGSSLILWIEHKAVAPTSLVVKPKG